MMDIQVRYLQGDEAQGFSELDSMTKQLANGWTLISVTPVYYRQPPLAGQWLGNKYYYTRPSLIIPDVHTSEG